MDVHNMMLNTDPQYKLNHENLEKFIRNFIEQYKDKGRAVINIPVVVHVVYNTTVQNVSMDQIYSQIEVLNKDFRKINIDTANIPIPFKSFASDLELQFCLARRDPSGNPSLGVTRTYSSVVNWGLSSGMKFTASGGHDAWPNTQYLNMWVCNLGSGLLGFATFPGGNPATDGVVINYSAFGTIGSAASPFNKGRTATHEVGHWLSLYHIWGDDNGGCNGSDYVEDTPNQGGEYYGCPSFPQISCNNEPNGAMFMNYMDYTNDECMFMFTSGQKQRTSAVMSGVRLPLQTSQGCQDISGVPICQFSADSITIPYGRDVQFTDRSAGIPTQWQWNFTGGNPATSNQQNPVVIYSTPGLYTVKLKVLNSHGSDSLIKTSYIRVLGAPLNPFTLVTPPAFSRINVVQGDTAKTVFKWTRSSVHPSIRYKFKIKKIPGVNPEYTFNSDLSGTDSLFSVTGHVLDSIARLMTGNNNYDSVRVAWRVYAFNGLDSLPTDARILTLGGNLIGIEQISSNIPAQFNLYDNYPNPFNPTTKIKFDVAESIGNVKLIIYNSIGQIVTTLVNEELRPGTYEVDWSAENFSSGIYFYQLITPGYTATKKMLLIK
jgi:PKD repeat protein